MNLILVSQEKELGSEWAKHFAGQPNVSIIEANIGEVPCDAVVSPAFSFGLLEAEVGIALEDRFGPAPEIQFMRLVRATYEGELPVGQSVIVPTGDAEVPWLIAAPTMTASEGGTAKRKGIAS